MPGRAAGDSSDSEPGPAYPCSSFTREACLDWHRRATAAAAAADSDHGDCDDGGGDGDGNKGNKWIKSY